MVRRQHQKKVIRCSTTQHILSLLPEIRPVQQLRKIRTDQRGTGCDTSGNIGPVCAVESISRSHGIRANTGNKGCGIITRMTAKHKIQCTQHIIWLEIFQGMQYVKNTGGNRNAGYPNPLPRYSAGTEHHKAFSNHPL